MKDVVLVGLLCGMGANAALFGLAAYERRQKDAPGFFLIDIFRNRALALRVFAGELFCGLVYLLTGVIAFLTSLPRWLGRRPPHPMAIENNIPTIILVHGYRGFPALFWMMRLWLRIGGVRNVVTYGYGGIDCPLEELHERMRDFVLALYAEKEKIGPTVLVGVSMGGIICHDYAHRYGPGEVKGVLALGSPFHGTRLASFGLSGVARKLHPGSPWLARALKRKLPKISFTSLYSRYDQIVIPYSNSRHPFADENRVVECCGHFGFYFEPMVLTAVVRWIKNHRYE